MPLTKPITAHPCFLCGDLMYKNTHFKPSHLRVCQLYHNDCKWLVIKAKKRGMKLTFPL